MAFDKTQPANTTKLRKLGDVIRPNWAAIETAEATFKPQALNLADRTAAGLPIDPTAIADTNILYSKQNIAGKPQTYVIDPDSVITPLTGGTESFAVKGHVLLPNGFKMNWGIVVTALFVPVVETFDSAFLTAVYSIQLTPVTVLTTATATVVEGTVALDKFSIISPTFGVNIYYLAIGK